MKKITALLLAVLMVFSFAACAADEGEEGQSAISGNPNKSAAGKLLFEKDITVTQGRDAVLKFYGEPGALSKIEVTVNGEEQDALTVADAAKKVIGTEAAAKSSEDDFGFFIKDMNFDGYQDFGVQAWEKEGTVPYYCWFWNVSEGNFAFSAELESPVFDAANSKIYCNVTEDGDEYINVYSVSGGELTLADGYSLSAAPQFENDLSAYEQYMNPADRDAYLILVNYENTLDENYVPDDLADINNTRQDGRATQQMRYVAAEALYALYMELFSAGYTDVSVTSAYRSYEYQSELFNSYINQEIAANGYTEQEAYDIVKTYSAVPGTSEHQTGLCCDMHNLGSADQAFAKEDAYRWLSDNAWKFGFILRFPENKEDITKITFEPWHYRFVGRYHAAKIHAMGLCLEEYVALINK